MYGLNLFRSSRVDFNQVNNLLLKGYSIGYSHGGLYGYISTACTRQLSKEEINRLHKNFGVTSECGLKLLGRVLTEEECLSSSYIDFVLKEIRLDRLILVLSYIKGKGYEFRVISSKWEV